ncbi:MAG: 50S ribosomal protein L5 [Candidatus Hydrothermarchaeaceae archaeon]
MSNVMRDIRLSKVTVNIGVGEGGEKLAKAEKLLGELTNQMPVKTLARSTIPTFTVRKGVPIACKVTLRNKKAEEFLKKAFSALENRLSRKSFDKAGNVTFGIKEHIDIPGTSYDPSVGIFGMDVALTVERPGYRIKRRRIAKAKVSKKHRVTSEEAVEFIKKKYNVIVED